MNYDILLLLPIMMIPVMLIVDLIRSAPAQEQALFQDVSDS